MPPTSSRSVQLSTQGSRVNVDESRRVEHGLRPSRWSRHPAVGREAFGYATAPRQWQPTAVPTSSALHEEALPGSSFVSCPGAEGVTRRPWPTLSPVHRSASPSQTFPGDHSTMKQVHDHLPWPTRPEAPTPLSAQNRFAPLEERASHPTTQRPYAEGRLNRHVQRLRLANGWQVFTEDDDDDAPSVHETSPTMWTSTVADTREQIPIPSRPLGAPFSNPYASPRQDNTTSFPPEPGPLLNQARPTLDGDIIPKASVNRYASGARPDSFAHKIAQFYSYLLHMFQDLAEYKKFLSYRDEEAQRLVNLLQMLLDYSPPVEGAFRILFTQALLRLSRKSELYPQCFALTDVTRQGEYPVTNGHFGEIYKGSFRRRLVCLKVVKMYEKSDPAPLYKAFSREAVLWGQLAHPNVLPFYGIYRLGDTRNRIGLVSPWLENGNVEEFLEKHPDADRRLLILDVARGMLYLHNSGVVHSDLKCANVLVTDSGRACLVDFGLSVIRDTRSLNDKDLSSNAPEGGTIRYQAPELLHPHTPSPSSKASDVYAFSILCYHIITGDCPFSDAKDFAVILRVVAGERPRRRFERLYLDRGLTDPMWKLMEDCWSQAPDGRPHAREIVARLPRPSNEEQRHDDGWGDLFRSRFRASGGYDRFDHHDFSVADMFRIL